MKVAGVGNRICAADLDDVDDASNTIEVDHDASRFAEGVAVTLTLADRPIIDKRGELNEDEVDRLENSVLREEERLAERKKKRAACRNAKGTIGGEMDEEDVDAEDENTQNWRGVGICSSLTTPNVSQISDYYTPEEVSAKFRTKRESKFLKEREKLQLHCRRSAWQEEEDDCSGEVLNSNDEEGTKEGFRFVLETSKNVGSSEVAEDEDDKFLYDQLNKQRKLSQLQHNKDRVDMGVAVVSEYDMAEKRNDGTVSIGVEISETQEFCRNVRTTLEKMESIRGETFSGSALFDEQRRTRGSESTMFSPAGRSKSSGEKTENEIVEEDKKKDEATVFHEAELDNGLASALSLLKNRGELGDDPWRVKRGKSEVKPLHMSTDNGDIKLEYKDDFGQVMNQKEAFRYISWVFHGKKPGKRKEERLMLRYEREKKLKAMDPSVELPTLRALRTAQKDDGCAHLVLTNTDVKRGGSGGSLL